MEERITTGVHATRQILSELLADFPRTDYAVRFWDGSEWKPPASNGSGQRAFTMVLRHPGSLRSMFRNGMLGLGEAFLLDDFDVEGDLLAACELGDHLLRLKLPMLEKVKLGLRIRALPKPAEADGQLAPARLSGDVGSRKRLRDAIAYHYDLPVGFWKAWLDTTLAYSCAYFKDPSNTLDEAQRNKLDYVCRKLYLQPGERLLDLGCGWGGLVMHAVRNYGVTALGITLSRKQAEYGASRIKELGLEDRCEIRHMDFRDYRSDTPYDKVACIGAVEHVPVHLLGAYFAHAKSLVKPGGLFLNHGITAAAGAHPSGPSFVDAYVFPDHGVTTVSQQLVAAEGAGFEVRDVECLREHYIRTCTEWLHRIEGNAAELARQASAVTQRIFRLYVAVQTYYFYTGASSIHQMLLASTESKPAELPMTRAAWYAAG